MCDDKSIVVDPKPATSIHHFISGGERHGAAQRAAEIEREHHILLLQRRSPP
jgi:hypothetical protein